MTIACITCLCFALIFGLITLIFTVLKEKAAMLISGFNTMPKQQRELYDTSKMSSDHRNQFLWWSLLWIIGALLSQYVTQYAVFAVGAVWLILLFRNVHLWPEKAFNRYLQNNAP